MQRPFPRLLALVAAVLVFHTIAAPGAHAYIDPGSSSFIIQILIGAVAGAGLAIATFWRRIRGFFAKLFGRDTDTPSTPPTPPPAG